MTRTIGAASPSAAEGSSVRSDTVSTVRFRGSRRRDAVDDGAPAPHAVRGGPHLRFDRRRIGRPQPVRGGAASARLGDRGAGDGGRDRADGVRAEPVHAPRVRAALRAHPAARGRGAHRARRLPGPRHQHRAPQGGHPRGGAGHRGVGPVRRGGPRPQAVGEGAGRRRRPREAVVAGGRPGRRQRRRVAGHHHLDDLRPRLGPTVRERCAEAGDRRGATRPVGPRGRRGLLAQPGLRRRDAGAGRRRRADGVAAVPRLRRARARPRWPSCSGRSAWCPSWASSWAGSRR